MQPMMLNDNYRWDCIFCLFQIVKIPSLLRYKNFQTFNPILEDFLIVFFGIPLRRFNMEASNFWREVYFCQQDFS